MNQPIKVSIDAKKLRKELMKNGQYLVISMQPPTSIFEVVDVTEEETHYPIGIFLTLESAIAAIESQASPWNLAPYDREDVCELEIRKRPIGFSQDGKRVWSRKWVQEWSEEDSSKWVVKP